MDDFIMWYKCLTPDDIKFVYQRSKISKFLPFAFTKTAIFYYARVNLRTSSLFAVISRCLINQRARPVVL